MKKHHFSAFLIVALCCFTACDPDEPEIPNEEELITTLTYTLTPDSGGSPVELSFVDLDGEDGGNAPTIVGGILEANRTYTGEITLLNESESPAENITEEVEEEALEHQFFFNVDLVDVSINYSDEDSMGNPIGLTTSLTTGEAGGGSITIILRHKPEKSETGVSNGDITNAGGDTDIEVTFPVDVQ